MRSPAGLVPSVPSKAATAPRRRPTLSPGAQAVITMLPTRRHVLGVIAEIGGLLAAGPVLLDMASGRLQLYLRIIPAERRFAGLL
jgi:3-hydroxyisobutyrate dehydrogenase-like beta-hydroxyacid dehydrogenase